jgi:hypothetical protein
MEFLYTFDSKIIFSTCYSLAWTMRQKLPRFEVLSCGKFRQELRSSAVSTESLVFGRMAEELNSAPMSLFAACAYHHQTNTGD